MIFLGAEASKVLRIKTSQEMASDFVNKMRDKGYSVLIEDIIKSLKGFGLTPDFESIHTVLEALMNPKDAVRKTICSLCLQGS